MIKFDNVSFGYTKKELVLEDISFEVMTGAFHGLVGNNGTGKSTLMRLLIGALNLQSGDILINGHTILDHKLRHTLISFIPDNVVFPSHLSTINYLYNEVMLVKDKDKFLKNKIKKLLDQFGMSGVANKNPNKLSKGEQKKIELIRIILEEPELIILDEPTNYLDPEARTQLLKFLKVLNQEKQITILISSHVLEELKLYIDAVTILTNKGVAYSGTVQGDEVIKIYNEVSEYKDIDIHEKI